MLSLCSVNVCHEMFVLLTLVSPTVACYSVQCMKTSHSNVRNNSSWVLKILTKKDPQAVSFSLVLLIVSICSPDAVLVCVIKYLGAINSNNSLKKNLKQ